MGGEWWVGGVFLFRGVGLVGSRRRTSAAPPYVSSAVAASGASPASASSRDAARTRARSSRGNEGSLDNERRGSPGSPLEFRVAFETPTVAFAEVEAHAALAHAIANAARSARRASAPSPRRRARMVETRDNLHLRTGARALGSATPREEREVSSAATSRDTLGNPEGGYPHPRPRSRTTPSVSSDRPRRTRRGRGTDFRLTLSARRFSFFTSPASASARRRSSTRWYYSSCVI